MEILVAKISPVAKVPIVSQNLFQNPSTVECDYMLAEARPYTMGAPFTNFQIRLGKVVTREDIDIFEEFMSTTVQVTSEELSNWGENDEDCYTAIAAKLGISCVSFRNINRTN